MEMLKRTLAFIMAMIMMLAMVPMQAEAAATPWEKSAFEVFGIASQEYFVEGETPSNSTVYNFVKMHLDEYVEEDANGYYVLSYEKYMEIVATYFENYNEMKEYLSGQYINEYDEATDQVKIYNGGFGGGVDCALASTEKTVDGQYVLHGFCFNIYLDNGVEMYKSTPQKLTLSSDVNGEWKIVAYEADDTYVECENTADYIIFKKGDSDYVLYKCNEGEVYSHVSVEEAEGTTFASNDLYTFACGEEFDYWYRCDQGFSYEVTGEGYYIPAVVASAASWGDALGASDTIEPYSETVALKVIAEPIIKVEQENAKITFTNGYSSYAMADESVVLTFDQGANLTFKVQADEGYEVVSVTIDGEQVQYLESSETYSVFPSYGPITIKIVTTNKKIIKSEDSSVGDVSVEIDIADKEQFEDLTLVVEKLETTASVLGNVKADDVYILDIFFENESGEEVKVDAKMTVTVPIPEGWDSERIAVYYVNPETGEMTDMGATVSQDGKTVSFQTTHFSNYALVQVSETSESGEDVAIPETPEISKPSKTEAPKTGDLNNLILWSTTFVTSFGVVVANRKRKN